MDDRRTMALELRALLGDRLVWEETWGSMVGYSTHNIDRCPYGSKHTKNGYLDKIADHYDGSSSVLAVIDRYADPRDGETYNVRRVDRFHKVSRGWAHGFAYGAAYGPRTGLIYEARSFWVEWGAHRGDMEPDGVSENLEAFPVYWNLGHPDPITEAALDAEGTLRDALYEIAGFRPLPYGHCEVSKVDYPSGCGEWTCPGPTILAHTQQMREMYMTDDPTTRGIQESLKLAGYYEGEVDGIWGPETQKAHNRMARQAHDVAGHRHRNRLALTTGNVVRS